MNHPLSSANTTTIFGQFNANALKAIGLMDKVRDRLLWQEDALWYGIRNSKVGDVNTIKHIREIYFERPQLVRDTIGNDLMDEILKF